MSQPFRIYHNPDCSKSRGACALLAEAGVDTQVVDYLVAPPAREELQELLRKLGLGAAQLLRRSEPAFQARFGEREPSDAEALEALLAEPILLERPIVVRGERAVIARPPERVKELF